MKCTLQNSNTLKTFEQFLSLLEEIQNETKKFVLECCSPCSEEKKFVKSSYFNEEIADTYEIYREQILTRFTSKIKKDGKVINVYSKVGKVFNTETDEEITDKMLNVVINVV